MGQVENLFMEASSRTKILTLHTLDQVSLLCSNHVVHVVSCTNSLSLRSCFTNSVEPGILSMANSGMCIPRAVLVIRQQSWSLTDRLSSTQQGQTQSKCRHAYCQLLLSSSQPNHTLQWFPVLFVYGEDIVARRQACGLWSDCRRDGCGKGYRRSG